MVVFSIKSVDYITNNIFFQPSFWLAYSLSVYNRHFQIYKPLCYHIWRLKLLRVLLPSHMEVFHKLRKRAKKKTEHANCRKKIVIPSRRVDWLLPARRLRCIATTFSFSSGRSRATYRIIRQVMVWLLRFQCMYRNGS